MQGAVRSRPGPWRAQRSEELCGREQKCFPSDLSRDAGICGDSQRRTHRFCLRHCGSNH